MNRQHSARGLLRDLAVPVLVLVAIGALLFVQQSGYRGSGASGFDETFIDQDRWEALAEEYRSPVWNSGRNALLVWASNDDESLQVYDQVSFVLTSVGVDVTSCSLELPSDGQPASSLVLSEKLPNGCTDVIICLSSLLSSGIDPTDLASWVAEGGYLLIAGGLEPEEMNDSWLALLGMTETDLVNSMHVDSMLFATDLLAGAEGMEFSDEVIACDAVRTQTTVDCTVHITTADDSRDPLLWECDYGKGHVLVCNADLMDSKASRGIIIASFSRMNDAFVYPVINAAVYCIDDFPSAAPAGYDRNVLSQYGYTIGDFYANVWWPSMQRIAEKYGIPYSGFLIQCYEADVNGPFQNTDNQPSATYFVKQLLEYGGEVGLHGYDHQPLVLEGFAYDEKNSGYQSWQSVEDMLASIQAALAYGASLSDDVVIQSYVAPSNVLGREAMDAMIRQFDDLRIFAGVYIGTPDQLIEEFEVLEDNVVLVPRLTADMQMEDSEWWLQINELNYHYFESNYIHPDDILDEERNDGGDFKAMLNGYEQMVAWNCGHGLTASTISQAAGAVQRYCLLSVSQVPSNDRLDIHVSGLVDEGYLMLRCRKNVKSISGAQINEIDDGCYVIRTEEQDIYIEWEDKP